MRNLGNLLKQAQDVQTKLAEVQDELARREVEGRSGGGLVQVTLTAKGKAVRVKIDPTLLVPDEVAVLEDLLIAAFGDAKDKAEAVAAEEMQKVTGGLPLPPGFKLPF
jgi:DNA-binding YbaB/EbfC family protein